MFDAIEKSTGKRMTVYAVDDMEFLVSSEDGGFVFRDMEQFSSVEHQMPVQNNHEDAVKAVKGPKCVFIAPEHKKYDLDTLLDNIASGKVPVALGFTISTCLLDGTAIDLVVTDFDDTFVRLETRDCLGINTSATNLDTYLRKVYNLLPDALKRHIAETERVHSKAGCKPYTEKVKLFVPAASEIFPSDECYGDKGLYQQMEWYKDVHNRERAEEKGGDSHWYWTSSPIGSDAGYFCGVYSGGIAGGNNASNTNGLAPFGCIISKI